MYKDKPKIEVRDGQEDGRCQGRGQVCCKKIVCYTYIYICVHVFQNKANHISYISYGKKIKKKTEKKPAKWGPLIF